MAIKNLVQIKNKQNRPCFYWQRMVRRNMNLIKLLRRGSLFSSSFFGGYLALITDGNGVFISKSMKILNKSTMCFLYCFNVVLLTFGYTCIAQNKTGNCFDLQPEESEFGYKALADRCEGFFIPKYAGILQVVSFTRGQLQYELDQSTQLIVRPAVSGKSNLKIRAVSLNRNVHYQMDTELNFGGVFRWPVAPYLYNNKRKIISNELGVYGWTGEETNKIFFPVIIESSTKTDTPIDSMFRLNIIPVTDLTHFRWRFTSYDLVSGCLTEEGLTTFQDYEGDKSAGAVLEITSPLFSRFRKTLCMEIRYRPDNKSWRSELLKLNLGE